MFRSLRPTCRGSQDQPAPWSETAAAEFETWRAERTWDENEAALRSARHLKTDQGRADLHIIRMLYPDQWSEIDGLESFLDLLRLSPDVALAAMGLPALHLDTVIAWMRTPTWQESRRLIADHLELLLDPATNTLLQAMTEHGGKLAEKANRHIAILGLCRSVGINDAYDILTDIDTAADAAWDAIFDADGDRLMLIIGAAQNLLGDYCLAHALTTFSLLLRPEVDLRTCAELMAKVREECDATQRQALIGRLRRLLRHRGELENSIAHLVAILQSE